MRGTWKTKYIIGYFILLNICLPLWAQIRDSNPFAPLSMGINSEESHDARSRKGHDDDVSQTTSVSLDSSSLMGILWQKQRPVAIINDLALTVGSRLGTAQVVAIDLQSVILQEVGGHQYVLHLQGGLAAGNVHEEIADVNMLHVHVESATGRVVLEALAYQSGLNLIFVGDDEVQISLHLRDVTWEQALHAVLQASNSAVTVDGQTLIVQHSQKTMATQTFPLNHGKSKDLEAAVNKLLSEEGKLGVDERLNALVVSDSPENLKRIEEAIAYLDRKAPQVLIEVLIVNVILTEERKMGMDWQILFNKAAGEGIALTQQLGATNLSNPSGSASYAFITGDWEFLGLVDFVENQDDVTVLASPKVFVLNNHTASIDAVEEIPYQELNETGNGSPIGTTAFKEAGVKLKVTPQITDDGYIVMHVMPEQSARVGTFTINNADTPVVETRKSETSLRVKDGQTVIIGGLRKKEPFRKENRIPLLADIPLVGKLFRKVHVKEVDSELAVFITPRIYRDGTPAGEDLALVHEKDDLKALWDKKVISK